MTLCLRFLGGNTLTFFQDAAFLAARPIANEPWFLTRVIAEAFGFVIDFLFNIVYTFTTVNSLGLAIILLTILFRAAMLPLTIKSQKSMMNMRKIQPELKKIDEKYGKSKDPEIMKKIQAEKSALMSKHDANPLKGCLPMLLQMPLFFGLLFIMNQAFLYVSILRDLYYDLAAKIIAVPGLIGRRVPGEEFSPGLLDNLAVPLIPNRMLEAGPEVANLMAQGYTLEAAMERAGQIIAIGHPPHLSKVLNRFTSVEWDQLFDYIATYAPEHLPAIMELFNRRGQITSFLGLSVVEPGGWTWPHILIPILVAVTMFASAWLTQLRTADPDADERVKLQQRLMLVMMPLVLAFVTVGLPVAVGIYWIASQVFGVVQDIVMNMRAGIKFKLPFVKYEE